MSSAAAMFKGIGGVAGIKVWRVVKFDLELVSQPGSFYTGEPSPRRPSTASNRCPRQRWISHPRGLAPPGDSYLVLHSFQQENKLLHNLFYWLGSETTQVWRVASAPAFIVP